VLNVVTAGVAGHPDRGARWAVSLLVVWTLILASCAGSVTAPVRPSASGARAEVRIVGISVADFAFAPAMLEVIAGTTVVWLNSTNTGHTVTFTDSFDQLKANGTFNELLSVNDSVPRTVTRPGSYFYFCSIHTSMHGVLRVTGP
jgi:plastocyanin